MTEQQQQPEFPQPKKNSLSYRIGDLEAQDAHQFFNSGDWHLDNTFSFTDKLKTTGGSAKFVLKGKPSTGSDGTTFKLKYDTQLDTTINGTTAQFKVNPGKITSHFDLGFRQLGKNWLNSYVVVSTPTTFRDINADSKTTIGNVFHMNVFKGFPGIVHGNLDIAQRDGRYTFNLTKNSLFTWNNFTLSNIARINLSGPIAKKSSEVSLQYADGPVTANFGLVTSDPMTLGQGVEEISAGLTHQATKKLQIAAEAVRTLGGDSPSDAYNIGLKFDHCDGFNWRLVTRNFETIAMLMKLNSKKNGFDVSACYEKGLKDQDHFNWGLKFTYNQ